VEDSGCNVSHPLDRAGAAAAYVDAPSRRFCGSSALASTVSSRLGPVRRLPAGPRPAIDGGTAATSDPPAWLDGSSVTVVVSSPDPFNGIDQHKNYRFRDGLGGHFNYRTSPSTRASGRRKHPRHAQESG
jgi:hypothetical protein